MARTFQKTKQTGEDVQNTSKFAGVMSRREGAVKLRQQKALQQNQDKPKPGTIMEFSFPISKSHYIEVLVYITQKGESPSKIVEDYFIGEEYKQALDQFYQLNISSQAKQIRKMFRENYGVPDSHAFKEGVYSPPHELYYWPKMGEQEGMGYFWNMEEGGPVVIGIEEKATEDANKHLPEEATGESEREYVKANWGERFWRDKLNPSEIKEIMDVLKANPAFGIKGGNTLIRLMGWLKKPGLSDLEKRRLIFELAKEKIYYSGGDEHPKHPIKETTKVAGGEEVSIYTKSLFRYPGLYFIGSSEDDANYFYYANETGKGKVPEQALKDGSWKEYLTKK